MRLTTFTDYTLRVLMYLALEPERRATIPEIASAHGISGHHLMKAAYHLKQSGVVASARGKGGGICLAHHPRDIRLGQVIRASEGTAAIVECQAPEEKPCRIAPACRLTAILVEAFQALYDYLDRYTLEDLVGNREDLRRALASHL